MVDGGVPGGILDEEHAVENEIGGGVVTGEGQCMIMEVEEDGGPQKEASNG